MKSPKKPETPEEEDVLVMGPDIGDEHRPFCRKNSEGIHAGIMRPVKEGEALNDRAFTVEHQGPGPLYRVKPIIAKNAHSRPATAAYVKGWDRIFGGKATVGQA